MSTARERVQQEAEEHAAQQEPLRVDGAPHQTVTAVVRATRKRSFIAGRTVSAEMIEEAAESICDDPAMEDEKDMPRVWHRATEEVRNISRTMARNAFTAAGFIVEEES